MTKNVGVVPPERSFAKVVNAIRVRELPCLVVCEEDRVLGTISDRNLVRAFDDFLAGRRDMPTQANEIMTSPAITIRHSETTQRALELMDATSTSSLPVVDDQGTLLGLVSRTNLLRDHLQRTEMHRSYLEHDLAERTRELVEANMRLQNDSLQDHLLGIANRRAMNTDLDQLHEMAMRFQYPYAILLTDVDHFKAYNDRYGHPAGDRVLRQIADTVSDAVRKIDRIYRYGGEELLVALPKTNAEGAHKVAERARGAVEALAIPHEKSPFGVVTVSCGICIAGEEGKSPQLGNPLSNKPTKCSTEPRPTGATKSKSQILLVRKLKHTL